MTQESKSRSYVGSLSDSSGRWFAVGTVVMGGLSLPTQVLFERGLGVDGFAQWLLVNALVSFFVPLAAFGSANLILSEFFEGRLNTSDGRRALARFFAVTTVIAAIGFVVVYGWSRLGGRRTTLDVALGFAITLARTPVVLVYPFFQIHHRARLVAFWPAIENLGRFLLSVASIALALSFTTVLGWWLALLAGLAVVGVRIARSSSLPPIEARATTARSVPESVAARGVRFGIAEYLDSLDLKLAIPVAAMFLAPKAIAGAGLGLLFLNAIYFFPYLIVTRYLVPGIHSGAGDDRAAVRKTILRWLVFGAVVSVIGGLTFAVFGADIVAILAEGDYRDQRFLFPVVGITMIPLCLSALAAAMYLRIEHAGRLLSWRVQATLVFLLVTIATAKPLGAAAPILGILVCRVFLLIRFGLDALRSRDSLDQPEPATFASPTGHASSS